MARSRSGQHNKVQQPRGRHRSGSRRRRGVMGSIGDNKREPMGFCDFGTDPAKFGVEASRCSREHGHCLERGFR
jgi:hypothetical protein